jgi:hypothetical protein
VRHPPGREAVRQVGFRVWLPLLPNDVVDEPQGERHPDAERQGERTGPPIPQLQAEHGSRILPGFVTLENGQTWSVLVDVGRCRSASPLCFGPKPHALFGSFQHKDARRSAFH